MSNETYEFAGSLFRSETAATRASVWCWASANGMNDAVETLDSLISGAVHGTLDEEEELRAWIEEGGFGLDFDISELCELGIEGAEDAVDMDDLRDQAERDEVAARVLDYLNQEGA